MRLFALVPLLLVLAASACSQPEKPREKEPLPMKVVEFHSRTVLVLAQQGPYRKIERAIEQVRDYLEAKEIMPAGPFMGVFLDDPEKVESGKTRYEIQVPVTNLTDAEPPFEVRVTKRITTAAVSLRGRYDKVVRRYPEAYEWIEKNGYEVAGPIIEVYIVAPGPNVPTSDLKTELHIPVRPAGR